MCKIKINSKSLAIAFEKFYEINFNSKSDIIDVEITMLYYYI